MSYQIHEKQGFSSQEQLDLQVGQRQQLKKINQTIDYQRIQLTTHFNVHPAEEIREKHYSLQPDMLSGWKPKLYLPKPIPLIFYNDQLDFAIQKLIKLKIYKQPNNNQENTAFIQLVYLGPRYQSTYSAWYQKPFSFPYTHLNQNKRLKFTDRQFVGQYWNAQTPNHLHFDSFFESGNLDVAFKIAEFQYDLFMRVDSNTRGHLQWFNFKVKNMIKGNTYKFNIANFLKAKSLYSRGMKPFIFSMRENEQKGTNWHQGGLNIKYEKKTPKSFKICKVEIERKPYRLSFQFDCEYENDEVQFAYCIPYEYSRLKKYLSSLQKRHQSRNIIKVSRMANSLGGLEIPVVTITSELKQTSQQEITNKKLIVTSGRIHPGQSNGSFMMEGFIEYLCGTTEEAQCLRSQIVFKIIPMLNPDGVVLGNYRTSLSGKDLNREFINPDQEIFPQVYHLKKYIAQLCHLYKKDFLMYLDFHGHSTKKNCFTYGPQFSITNTNYYQCRIFPKLISSQTEMFRFFSCVFKITQCKQRTLRAVLLKYFQLDLVYTLEVSNGSYYNHQLLEDVMFDQEKWQKMGEKIGKSVFQYVMIFIQLEKFKQIKKQQRFALKKQKDKLIIKNNILKKQNSLNSKDRTSRSANKSTPLKGSDKYSIGKISPVKRKVFGYQQSEMNDSFNDSLLKISRQNVEDKLMFPELKDEKLNFLLKSIYFNNNKSSEQTQFQETQNQKELFNENKSTRSDDNISEGGSDSSSSSQDLNQIEKKNLFKSIKLGSQKIQAINSKKKKKSPQQQQMTKNSLMKDDFSNSSQQNQNQPETFFTEIDNSSNSLEQLRPNCKINSIKLNQLRSKKHIYLKKKSYYIYNSSSPKRQQQNSQTAKIVNFQFSLNPIRTANKVWHEKQPTTNAIHSIFKQNSKEKIQSKIRQVPLLEYMNKSYTQRNEEIQPEKFVTNIKRRIFSAQKDKSKLCGHTSVPKNYNIALLRKTQQKKLNVNSAFYKSQMPDKDIQDGNLKGKRILSQCKKNRCVTQISAYQ